MVRDATAAPLDARLAVADFEMTVDVFAQLGEVLARLENSSAPVAHRDIKPDNLFCCARPADGHRRGRLARSPEPAGDRSDPTLMSDNNVRPWGNQAARSEKAGSALEGPLERHLYLAVSAVHVSRWARMWLTGDGWGRYLSSSSLLSWERTCVRRFARSIPLPTWCAPMMSVVGCEIDG